MVLNEKNIKTFSLIGSRATFGMAALELVKIKKKMIILTSDVSTSAGLDRFRKNYSDNFIEIGAGNVLSGLVKRINKTVNSNSIQNIENIENYINILEG